MYYINNIVVNDNIPLFTLISSGLNLAINTAAILYNTTYHVTIPEYIPPNYVDDFVDSFTYSDYKKN